MRRAAVNPSSNALSHDNSAANCEMALATKPTGLTAASHTTIVDAVSSPS